MMTIVEGEESRNICEIIITSYGNNSFGALPHATATIINNCFHLPVPPSLPNKTFVLASCSDVKSDVIGMAVATVFLVL